MGGVLNALQMKADSAATSCYLPRGVLMNWSWKLAAMGLMLTGTACSNLERSRDLNDPQVSAETTAQQVCSICHGPGGNSISPNFPRLAAQQKEYFVAQLKGYRSHGRSDPAGYEYMWGLSRNLRDEQVEQLATYYFAQKASPNAPGDAVLSAEGAEIYKNGVPDKKVPACSACHGTDGQGAGAFPRLAGQHADYVKKQITIFQRTDQRPGGAVMKVIVHDLSARDVEAVAAYVQGLK